MASINIEFRDADEPTRSVRQWKDAEWVPCISDYVLIDNRWGRVVMVKWVNSKLVEVYVRGRYDTVTPSPELLEGGGGCKYV